MVFEKLGKGWRVVKVVSKNNLKKRELSSPFLFHITLTVLVACPQSPVPNHHITNHGCSPFKLLPLF